MKLYVKANSDIGYLYIFKHGTGPGTVPRDVVFLKEKDLPNGYTAVWLDRFLKTSELRAYDIPSETEINKYLDRIGYCQKDGDVVPCDEVEACGNVMAASNSTTKFSNTLIQKIKDEGFWYIVEHSRDSLDTSIVEALLYSAIYSKNPDYLLYLVNQDEYNSIRLAQHLGGNPNAPEEVLEAIWSKYSDTYETVVWEVVRNPNVPKNILEEALNSPFRSIRANAEQRLNSEVEACDTKYFANMVSASNDPELGDDFLIEGYYDNQRRGLAESAETSDVSALNELANEYANKGYYIVVYNLTDGVITEFSADNWFNDIAPDGGAGLFMSW